MKKCFRLLYIFIFWT